MILHLLARKKKKILRLQKWLDVSTSNFIHIDIKIPGNTCTDAAILLDYVYWLKNPIPLQALQLMHHILMQSAYSTG